MENEAGAGRLFQLKLRLKYRGIGILKIIRQRCCLQDDICVMIRCLKKNLNVVIQPDSCKFDTEVFLSKRCFRDDERCAICVPISFKGGAATCSDCF